MYEDKIMICKDCGAEFEFTAGEQEFYAEKDSPMSPSAARPAVQTAKIPEGILLPKEPRERCIRLYAHLAAQPARFPSSPATRVLYTAAIALRTEDNN